MLKNSALLLFSVQLLAACEAANVPAATTVYVRPAASYERCPSSPCHDVGYYADNIYEMVASNSVMAFLEGVHYLEKQLDFVGLEGINITGLGRRGGAEIRCVATNGFRFSEVERLSISSLTFTNCGIGSMSEEMFDSGALLFHRISDLVIRSVQVFNSSGFGLFGFNLMGNITIVSSSFLYNNAKNSGSTNGGNAKVIWSGSNSDNASASQDRVRMLILDSFIMHGASNVASDQPSSGGFQVEVYNHLWQIELSIKNCTLSNNRGKSGGNFGIYMEVEGGNRQSYPGVNITIEDTVIRNGSALSGGGISIITDNRSSFNKSCVSHHRNLAKLNVNFMRVLFERNVASESPYSSGGALLIQYNGVCSTKNLISIQDTTFNGNAVSDTAHTANNTGGAISIVAHTTHVLPYTLQMESSSFISNSAHTGGAISIRNEITTNGTSPLPEFDQKVVNVINCTFQQNLAAKAAGIFIQTATDDGVPFSSSLKYTFSYSRFMENKALHDASAFFSEVLSSQVLPLVIDFSDSSFHNNTIESSFQIQRNKQLSTSAATVALQNTLNASFTRCSFIGNQGSGLAAHGGFVSFEGDNVFQENHANSGGGVSLFNSIIILQPYTSITFTANRAVDHGGAIFVGNTAVPGSAILTKAETELCFLVRNNDAMIYLNGNTAGLAGDALYATSIDGCNDSELNKSVFNTENQTGLSVIATTPSHVCPCESNVPKCNHSDLRLSSFSGVPFKLSVATVGQMNGVSPGLVRASVQGNATLSDGLYQETTSMCTNMTYVVHSKDKFESLSLHIKECSDCDSELDISVELLPCPLGFNLTAGAHPECECSIVLQERGIECSVINQSFTNTRNYWIGLQNPNTSIVEMIAYDRCPFDYCKQDSSELYLADLDEQCAFNRSGKLCGGCRPGLSLMLGNSKCEQCSNKTLSFLIVFALVGFLLVAFMRICNFTISEGTLNSLIFYSSVVHTNRNIFFPQGKTNILTVFLSWLNFDFGFEVCMYNGMDAYGKAWLQFLFPVYIWVLTFAIIFTSKYSEALTKLMGRNAIRISLTLLVFSYMKIVRAAITAFPSAKLEFEHGSEVVWLYDGSVLYLKGKHTALAVTSILIFLLFCVPLMFLILFPSCIDAWSSRSRSDSVLKIKSFLEALSAPYKTKFSFWTGLLMLAYTILLIANIFSGGEPTLNLTLIALTGTVFLALSICFRGVYVKRIINILEMVVFVNLIATSTLVLVLEDNESKHTATYTSAGICFAIFVMVLCYHVFQEASRFKCINQVHQRIIEFWTRKFSALKLHQKTCGLGTWEDGNKQNDEEVERLLNTQEPFISDFVTDEAEGPWPTWGHQPLTYREPVFSENLSDDNQDTVGHTDYVISPTGFISFPRKRAVLSLELAVDRDNETAVLVNAHDSPEHVQRLLRENAKGTRVEKILRQRDLSNGKVVRDIPDSEMRIKDKQVVIEMESLERHLSESELLLASTAPAEKSQTKKEIIPLDTFSVVTQEHHAYYNSLGKKPSVRDSCPLNLTMPAKFTALEDSHKSDTSQKQGALVEQLRNSYNIPRDRQGSCSTRKKRRTLQTKRKKSKKLAEEEISLLSEDAEGELAVMLAERNVTLEQVKIPTLKAEKFSKMSLKLENDGRDLLTSQMALDQVETDQAKLGDPLPLKHPETRLCHTIQLQPLPQEVPSSPKQTIGSKFANSVDFLDPIAEFTVDSCGTEYEYTKYNITIKVPQGAIPSTHTVAIEVGLTRYGPFKFPKGTRQISPILWVCMKPANVPLLKPIEISMPHILADLTPGDCSHFGLQFVKTHHNAYRELSNGKMEFTMSPFEAEANFESNFGTVFAKHFCFQCIVAKISPEMARKEGYCLTYFIPEPWPSTDKQTFIYIYITYFLETCLETLQRLVPQSGYRVEHKPFTFKAGASAEVEETIKLNIATSAAHRWHVVSEREEQFTASHVDVWRMSPKRVQLLEKIGTYPPKFVLSVSGHNAVCDSAISVSFEGIEGYTSMKIPLLHRTFRPQRQLRWQSRFNSDGRSTSGTSEDPLDEAPDMRYLMNEVATKIPGKWIPLGIQLGVAFADLEGIRSSRTSENYITIFVDVFQMWKTKLKVPYTWAALITALESSSIDEQELAQTLRRKVVAGELPPFES